MTDLNKLRALAEYDIECGVSTETDGEVIIEIIEKLESAQQKVAALQEQVQTLAADCLSSDLQADIMQEQVQKLAADNSRYAAIAADLVCLPDEDINGITNPVRNILNRIVLNSVSPSTDAVIREIGAKAVEKVAVDEFGDGQVFTVLMRCAANLRAGEQL